MCSAKQNHTQSYRSLPWTCNNIPYEKCMCWPSFWTPLCVLECSMLLVYKISLTHGYLVVINGYLFIPSNISCNTMSLVILSFHSYIQANTIFSIVRLHVRKMGSACSVDISDHIYGQKHMPPAAYVVSLLEILTRVFPLPVFSQPPLIKEAKNSYNSSKALYVFPCTRE